MDDLSAIMAQDDKTEEELEPSGRHNEHVDRGDPVTVVAKKRQPAL
jgi:hypothetical protein